MSAACPLPADDLLDAFPLAAFLDSLGDLDIRPTLHDYDRISRVLSAGGRWDVARLRHVLTALLAQNPDQQEAVQRRFNAFFEQSLTIADTATVDVARALAELRQLRGQAAPPPEPGRSKPALSRIIPRRTADIARRFAWKDWRLWLGYLVIIIGLTVCMRWDARPVIEAPPIPPPEVDRPPPPPATGAQRYYPNAPFIRDSQPLHEAEIARWLGPAILGVGLLLIAIGYGVWLRRACRPPEDQAPVWDDEKPRHFNPGSIGGRTEPRLDRETLDHLADSLGYFQSEQPGQRLDVAASITASLNQGFPSPVFQRRQQLRQVLILEDAYAESLAWNSIAAELAEGLARRGVPVIHGRFQGVPDRFRDMEGRPQYLEDLEDQRRGCLLLIFSDGKGLSHDRDRFVLEALARWPRIAWLELRERRCWDESTAAPARLGITVCPASREGLLQVMERFMTEQGAPEPGAAAAEAWRGAPARASGTSLAIHLERLLGDALLWAQACAMMLPPISLGLADALRRRFHPDLPPERLERLQTLPGATFSAAGLRFAPPVLAALRQGFLARWNEQAQQQALEFLLAQITAAEPEDQGSPAHLAWEWRRERVRLELDPDRALERLSELAQGPLGESIRGELGRVVLVDRRDDQTANLIPLRLRPRTRDGLKRLLALAPRGGVAVTEAYPSVKVHRAALTGLALSGLATLGYAAWLYAQPGPQLFLALEPGVAERMEARLGRVEQGVWTPAAAAAAGRWFVAPNVAYRLALVNKGQPAAVLLEPLTESRSVTLGEGAARPCSERAPDVGLTVWRCPSGVGDSKEAVFLPGWRERLGEQAPAGRRLSVGLEIRLDDVPDPGLESLADSLLASASVDWLYRVTPVAETLRLEQALVRIGEELAPWQAETQLMAWVVGKNAEQFAWPELPPVGRTLLLGQGANGAWADVLVKRLKSKTPGVLLERDILAALKAGRATGSGAPVVLASGVKEKPAHVAAVPEPAMVEISAGEFLMGSPEGEKDRDSDERQHRLKIERPFALGQYEVTVGEFRRFVEATGYRTEAEQGDGCYGWTGKDWKKEAQYSWRKLGFEQTDDHPVACVSWNDAMAYADWLSQQTGRRYRLPTEAEWEYAARARKQTAYYWGDKVDAGCAYANGADLTAKDRFNWEGVMNCRDGYVFTAPVGRFKANDFKLYDMLGNVWEWTCSEYKESYDGAEQQCTGNNRASFPRALRGGSWPNGAPRYLRAASRDGNAPGSRGSFLGFRLARDL